MANTHTTLTSLFAAIANAIRSKTGGTGTIVADNFPTAIDSITTLSEGSADATAAASNILNGKTAYVKGSKVTGTIPTQAAITITPSATAQTAIAAGTYAAGAVTVAGHYLLTPENIRKGLTIFGVTGTYLGGIPVTITGTGSITYSYVTISGEKFTSATETAAQAGETITFGVRGVGGNIATITIDGTAVKEVMNTRTTYAWTVPSNISGITISLYYKRYGTSDQYGTVSVQTTPA